MMNIKSFFTLALGVSALTLAAALPTAKINSIVGDKFPKVDGRLDADEWKNATRLGDFVEASTGKKAINQTEVYLLKDKHVLYIGAKCYDKEMKNLSGKDWFEIFMADPDLKIYYHFFLFSNGGMGQDGSPGVFLFGAPHWQAKIQKYANRWEVEVAIPFFNLSPDYMNVDKWRFNICRQKVSGQKENSQWSCTNGYFHVPEKFGVLTGMKEMDFVPYVAISQRIRDEKTESYKLPTYFLLDRSYYTTEKKAELMLCLDSDTQQKLGGKGKAVVTFRGKKIEMKLNKRNLKSYASLDIAKLKPGKYPVTLKLTGNKVNKLFTKELEKLPPAESETKVNRFTRLLLVNGKPFIPLMCEIMVYRTRLPDKAAPPNGLEILARESGFNTFCLWWTHNKEVLPIFGKEKAMVIPAIVDIAAKKPPREARYTKTINAYKNFNNVIGWLIADEGNIGGSEAEYIKNYKLIKKLDPYRPVFRNESGWTIGYGGPGGLDTTDIFCGGYGGAKSARAISLDAVPHGKPAFLLTAAFGIPEKHRYLSGPETISWVYQILINGATGAFWWGAHSGQQPIASFWKTARQLRKEIDILTPVFNTIDPVAGITCSNENVTSVCRYLDGKYYLITTNLHQDREQAVYDLSAIKDIAKYKAKDLFGNKKFTIKNGKLTLQYDKWERVVICFSK